ARPQPRRPRLVPVTQLAGQVDDQMLAAGREAGQRRVALMPAGVPVVVRAETDDAGSPHRRRLAGDLLHQGAQPARVLAPPLIGHTGQDPRPRGMGGALPRALPGGHAAMLAGAGPPGQAGWLAGGRPAARWASVYAWQSR